MIKRVAPCTSQIVSVVIKPKYIQCFIWTTNKSGQLTLQYQAGVYSHWITLAQPAYIEKELRTFLKEHNMLNAFVAIAVASQNEHARTVAAHELLQCQLLAINTPFHCAGITAHALAQELAYAECAALPPNTSNLTSQEDFLCSIGLYLMARKNI